MRGLIRVLSIVVLGATSSSTSLAQQDQVPKELALALMPMGMAQGGEIIVGQMPPDLTSIVTLPTGARVLGSFVTLEYAQAVITLPVRTDSALAIVRRALLEHGWQTRSAIIPTMGGLQYGPPGGGFPNMYCKTGDPASLSIAAQFYGPSTSLVHITRNAGGVCEQPARMDIRQQTLQDFPLATVPPLWSPGDFRLANTRCRRTSNGSMGDQSQNQAVLTDLSLPELLAHYGKQLDSAGWKAGSSNDAERISKTWTKQIPNRGLQEVTITAAKGGAQTGCYDVSLRATGLPR